MNNGKNPFKCNVCGNLNPIDSIKFMNRGTIYYNLTVSEVMPFPKTLYKIKATLT